MNHKKDPPDRDEYLGRMYGLLIDFMELNNIGVDDGLALAFHLILTIAKKTDVTPNKLKRTFDEMLKSYRDDVFSR